MMVIGKPGSGKSALLEQVVNSPQLYGGRFNHILVVSPSWQKLNLPGVPRENMVSSLDLAWLDDKINEINANQIQLIEARY